LKNSDSSEPEKHNFMAAYRIGAGLH
jgi:hypothetical protein